MLQGLITFSHLHSCHLQIVIALLGNPCMDASYHSWMSGSTVHSAQILWRGSSTSSIWMQWEQIGASVSWRNCN